MDSPPSTAPTGTFPRSGPRFRPPVRLALVALLSWHAATPAHAAPGLRLLPPWPESDGGLRLDVVGVDPGPLTSERATRIAVLAATEPVGPLSAWNALPGPRLLTNGTLRLVHAPDPNSARQFFVAVESPAPVSTVHVRDTAGLRSALAAAKPGTRILVAPGTYAGGVTFSNVRGTPDQPIVLAGEDPANPPWIQGGSNGIQLTDPAYVELHDLRFAGATGNGLNIDDGGSFATPAHHVVLRGLRIVDVGPTGNRDGIKLSGVVDFRVENCTVERWGTGGSAIDMVGCHSGVISNNVFRHTPEMAAENGSGVQAKGGSRDIAIHRNRFEYAGSRAVNLGGSTGLEFFRPPLTGSGERWEARDIRVEGNTFIGSLAPVAFVGVDGAVVRFNTIYRPQRWAIRILQENTTAGFVASRHGVFTDNLVAFQSTQWASGGVNVGAGTAPGTFQFARNWWYCLDAPQRSRPTLPTPETGGTYGVSPQFLDASAGDLRLAPGSPAVAAGAEAWPPPAPVGNGVRH